MAAQAIQSASGKKVLRNVTLGTGVTLVADFIIAGTFNGGGNTLVNGQTFDNAEVSAVNLSGAAQTYTVTGTSTFASTVKIGGTVILALSGEADLELLGNLELNSTGATLTVNGQGTLQGAGQVVTTNAIEAGNFTLAGTIEVVNLSQAPGVTINIGEGEVKLSGAITLRGLVTGITNDNKLTILDDSTITAIGTVVVNRTTTVSNFSAEDKDVVITFSAESSFAITGEGLVTAVSGHVLKANGTVVAPSS
jgi:hypothetical protein